ncbi:MAG: hypothetical protein Q8876_07970 [Bacillota bacterium]|nr:hypothetical protein [Bacillota bacterium]
MIRINEVALPLNYNDNLIRSITVKTLNIDEKNLKSVSMFRRSIDARKKNDIHFIATLDIETFDDETQVVTKCRNAKVNITSTYEYKIPEIRKLSQRPVIIGAGPAGLFAALILAESGNPPLVIERGSDVYTRQKDIEEFQKTSVLNTESNIQFGEGGAGTFSDGKLNTGTKDPRARKVLSELADCGAPKEILYNAKPHVGTDYLIQTVFNLRNKIISLGGEFLFNTKFSGIIVKNERIVGIKVIKSNGNTENLDADNVILSIGHSARDTFEMLYNSGIIFEQKSFSVGTRIEHLREKINISQFGKFYNHPALGAADYKINVNLPNGRGVYTFCMCPGGTVVAAASEENHLVINGMSEFARNAINSNSALLVSVTPNDFGNTHPLAGVEFQRKIEAKAFTLGEGNYKAPVQRVEDFLKGQKTKAFGEVLPSYIPGVTMANLSECLPKFVTDSMRQALPFLERKLKGFLNPDAILTGVETRSSSPVRILRNEQMESVSLSGLYPCGEGAGYAGGIVSAAVDGIKVAENILKK